MQGLAMGAGFAIGQSLFGPDGIPIIYILMGGAAMYAAFKAYQAFRFYRQARGYYNFAKEVYQKP